MMTGHAFDLSNQRLPVTHPIVAGLLALAVNAAPLRAQCPDGTPPPCGRAARSPGKSLAVLPFESVGGDTANAYFAQGLADELTTALSHVTGLRVAASSSAFTFGSAGVDARRVGRALQVGAVLEGRVRREGNRMRVVARLINTANGLLLWSNSYEREVRDVFAVQDDLTRDIVAALRVTLASGRESPRPAAAIGTRSLAAYDLYLRGRYFLVQRGPGVERSIPYFQQAIALDSGFARAWAQLGTAWAVLPLFALVARDSAMPRAHAATDVALRLDPSSAEAHAAAGIAWLQDSEFRRAAAELERAIGLDTAYTFPHRPYMSVLDMLGRTDDAIVEGRRAVAMDPLQSTTASVLSCVLVVGRRYDEAVAVARRGAELDAQAPLAWANLAIAEFFAGLRDAAIAAAGRAAWLPNSSVPIAYVVGATASRDSVDALVRRLEGERPRNSSALTAIAFARLGAGDTTRALDALERMAQAREPVGFQAPFNHPAYDAIRASARFAALVRAYGLDERTFTTSPGR
jgi:eukaryotic-like serine/threonine-protein kinase